MFRAKHYIHLVADILPLFAMTFGICLFIVLMQFLWRYIDDMVGKGLEIPVLAELFFYAALYMVPMALPLAILLASLMTFGNLGERLELLAMKAAGISLRHIMRPLIITLVIVSIPRLYSTTTSCRVTGQALIAPLLHAREVARTRHPEALSITATANVYVKERQKTGLLKDMMIYDIPKGSTQGDCKPIRELKTSADKLFLVLSLYNGESLRSKNSGLLNYNCRTLPKEFSGTGKY